MDLDMKKEAIRIIERMPEGASMEEIMYELYFQGKVERGIREAREGQLIPHDEVKRNMREWLSSSGQ